MDIAELVAARSRGTGKRVLDVEDALRWAFREELPKRGYRPAGSFVPSARQEEEDELDDNFAREPGFPPALGEPHPDALIIRDTVRALIRYRDHSLDGVNIAPDFGGADTAIALREAMPMMIILLQRYAKLGGRPQVAASPPRLTRLNGPNGAPVVRRKQIHYLLDGTIRPRRMSEEDQPIEVEALCRATRGGLYPEGAYSSLAWTPDPQGTARSRAEYLTWWTGLDALARDLSGKLATITVLPPSAPAQPWAGDRELGKPAPVFSALRTPAQAWRDKSAAEAQRRRAERRIKDPRNLSSNAAAVARSLRAMRTVA